MSNILIVTVGLPRSGKSTWAKQQGCPMVNPDSIRLAIHGRRFVLEAEQFVWATASAMVRALFLAGHDRVILDATNVNRKRRETWEKTSGGLWEVRYKVMLTTTDTCITRAVANNDREIIDVINRMADKWEPLTEDEQKRAM